MIPRSALPPRSPRARPIRSPAPRLLATRCGLVACAFLAPRVAAADAIEARPASLSWIRGPGAETCLTGPELGRAVEARLGAGALVPLSRAKLLVTGEITKETVGFRATIAVTDEAGHPLGSRVVTRETPNCRALDDDLALVVAVTIDPDAGSRSTPSTASPAAGAPGPTLILQRERVEVESPTRAPASAPLSSAGTPEKPSLVFAGEGGGLLVAGALPGAAWGARGRLSGRPWGSRGAGAAFWLDLSASVLPDREADATFSTTSATNPTTNGAATSRKGVRIGLAWGEFGLCRHLWRSDTPRLHTMTCALGGVGAYQSTGFGVDAPRSDDRWYASVGASARARLLLTGPLFVGAGVGLSALVIRDRFVFFDAQGQEHLLYRPSPAAVSFEATVGFAL